jgi:hypothetical protein
MIVINNENGGRKVADKKVADKKIETPKAEATEETKAADRKPVEIPTKVGEERHGYTIAAEPVQGRYLLSRAGEDGKANRWGVYTEPWKKEGKIVLRAQKDYDLAVSVLKTGKIPEKPAPKKEDAPKK